MTMKLAYTMITSTPAFSSI